ncbi:hypothetical protein IGI04_011191 [Brassica rapa subsp. trilocularis]|uniref:SWIM-type domain-containing protein n=1 Tax=Brassica rapa subsp. trilocularis TaxID=1813537 RepID=A0ABQ7N2D0_BRACM|nr:hypothetical protein IGI04_011191 [Brassica rapa subsp. trilocularis]
MGRLVKLSLGLWTKNSNGDWSFEETSSYDGEAIVINNNETFDGLVELIRIRLNLGILTPVALTYQLPDWMIVPDGPKTPPITLSCDKDVEILTSVRDYMSEAVLYVTSGPELVARYEFLRRSPFTIGDTTYLEEGVSEAQHRQAILDLVGGHPIVCSKHILEIMFNEPQLLIVFRVALEIEMVYGLPNETVQAEEATGFPRLTVDDVVAMAEASTISPEEDFYYAENDEVLYGEPMNIEELQYEIPIGQPASILNHSTPLQVEPLNVWRDMTEDEEYWNGIADHENDYDVYYAQSTHPTEGVIGLPLAPNRRIAAPQPATIIIIDDDDGSTTASSDALNENNIITSGPPSEVIATIGMELSNNGPSVKEGDFSTEVVNINQAGSSEFPIGPTPENNSNKAEPTLDLTLTLGNKVPSNGDVPVESFNGSCSDPDEGSGNETNKSEELYVGKVFRNRADFKQQMASYALRCKFRFKNSRSSPDGMVLQCISLTCNWRVYAVKLKNVEKYEVRKLNLDHTCSVDERAENFEISGGMLVCQINAGEFDVKDKDGISYHVNLHTKSCSCFSFQTLLIPCPHAIAAAIKEKSSIESLVSNYYTMDTLVAAYAGNILPISSEVNPTVVKAWVITKPHAKWQYKKNVHEVKVGLSRMMKVFDKNGGL